MLDFSFYHLGDKGIKFLMPTLQQEHLVHLKNLDFSHNGLTDEGAIYLFESLSCFSLQLETLNISFNLELTDKTINILCDFMKQKLKKLKKVKIDGCSKITKTGEAQLKICLMKVSVV